MEKPDDSKLKPVIAINLLQVVFVIVIVVGFLDIFGRGTTLVSETMLLIAFSGFISIRLLVSFIVLRWMKLYIENSVNVLKLWLISSAIPIIVILALVGAVYEFLMVDTMKSLSLSLLFLTFMIIQYTEYEFKINDKEVISG